MEINPKFKLGEKVIFELKSHFSKSWSGDNGGIILSYNISENLFLYDIRFVDGRGDLVTKYFFENELTGVDNG